MIYLPWFPNGDPYSPPEPSVYHRYYGDYYQTYDLYMTSLTKLGNILARAINSPIASLLEYNHVFVDAYVPYSMPNTTPWVDKLYEFMKKWAVLDENVLEIYLFGGSHPYGYFDGNQWIWVNSSDQIPPDKAEWPGILEEGEYLYNFDVEFPIQLVPNTGIHYLTPDGNEVHWVFEHIGKNGLWKPKYPVLENSVVYEHGELPSALQHDLNTLPDPRTLLGNGIFETLRKVKAAYWKVVQRTYIPGRFIGLKENSCTRKYFPRYYLFDEMQCNPEPYNVLYRSNIDFIRSKAQEEGITHWEAFLAYVLEIPFVVILETRSTWVYDTHIASTTLARYGQSEGLPYYKLYWDGYYLRPYMSTWVSTTGPTDPNYRESAVRQRNLRGDPWLGYIPTLAIINDALEGRLIPYDRNNPAPDELTFVIMGNIILPPNPPKRVLGFQLAGTLVLGQHAVFTNGEVIETVTEIEGNNELQKVSLNFDDDNYYNKYYHCIVYANNNYWNKQSRPVGTVGRLPIFCKREDDPLIHENLILAPNLGLDGKSLSPEYIDEEIDGTKKKEYFVNRTNKVKIEVQIQFWEGGIACSGPARNNCGKTSREYSEGDTYEYTFISSNYRDELEWIENENRKDVVLNEVSDAMPVIDAHWLSVTQEPNDSYLSLENYTMPDSPRVKEMHLAIQALADAWSAKEMASR